jgi:hypothetical protein
MAIDLGAARINVDNRVAQTTYPWNFPAANRKTPWFASKSALSETIQPQVPVFALYQGTTLVVP